MKINNAAVFCKNDPQLEELYQFFKKYSPIPVSLNPQPESLRFARIYTSDLHQGLLNLSDTNELILICQTSQLTANHWLLMPKVKIIIANSYSDSINISYQLQAKGFDLFVTHLIPWCTSTPSESLESSKIPSTYQLVKSMISGRIVIAPNIQPYNEYVIDHYNGFLINNVDDVSNALKKIEKDYFSLSCNARSIITRLNANWHLAALMDPRNRLPKIKVDTNLIKYFDRDWIVREKILRNGKIYYLPYKQSNRFKFIDIDGINKVLNYFLNQNFNEVYVFNCEIPDELTKPEEIHFMRLLNKVGARSFKIHFCTDEPIPPAWNKIFTRLSILSIEEGLKQTSN